MALYIPHSVFHLARAFVCQAGNFWTLLHTKIPVSVGFEEMLRTKRSI